MKRRCRRIVLIAVLLAAACIGRAALLPDVLFPGVLKPAWQRVSACTCDLDGDGFQEEIIIMRYPGENGREELLIRSVPSGKINGTGHPDGNSWTIQAYSGIMQTYYLDGLNAWKVQAEDVDGDGRMEISVGVYKTTYFHPVPAKRPFIYNWSREGIFPKWLGSRLSRPFDDYIFADIDADGMDELISIECLSDGSKVINSYKWKGFGLEGMGESSAFDEVAGIEKGRFIDGKGFEVLAEVTRNKASERISLRFEAGMLVESKTPDNSKVCN